MDGLPRIKDGDNESLLVRAVILKKCSKIEEMPDIEVIETKAFCRVELQNVRENFCC